MVLKIYLDTRSQFSDTGAWNLQPICKVRKAFVSWQRLSKRKHYYSLISFCFGLLSRSSVRCLTKNHYGTRQTQNKHICFWKQMFSTKILKNTASKLTRISLRLNSWHLNDNFLQFLTSSIWRTILVLPLWCWTVWLWLNYCWTDSSLWHLRKLRKILKDTSSNKEIN